MNQNRRILIVNLFSCIQAACRRKYEKTGQKGKEVFRDSRHIVLYMQSFTSNHIKLDWYKKLKKRWLVIGLLSIAIFIFIRIMM